MTFDEVGALYIPCFFYDKFCPNAGLGNSGETIFLVSMGYYELLWVTVRAKRGAGSKVQGAGFDAEPRKPKWEM